MATTQPPPPIRGSAVVIGVVVAVVAVAGVLVFSWKHQRFAPIDGAPDAQARSAPPAPSTGTLDRDGRFLFLLTAQGLQLSAARDVTINDAHRVCSRLERGETEQQIVQDIVDGSPGMSVDTAAAFADTAISVYCPG
ncbi:DUF732 domain-containing protein [Mycobacterium heckeshornense]|uniref:DUF732 domain-containing protein n=1 Tax=Mycobacterium heckeshornense TaxID=110505 RepID=UPI001364DEDE|nr:DUF732 domain-containing protein [Mycobacterium heckeshornense]MCV7035368.1 DUF732 domain-containing protein [Mycobacterium heckeshornense]